MEMISNIHNKKINMTITYKNHHHTVRSRFAYLSAFVLVLITFSLLVLLFCNVSTSNKAFAQVTYPFMASSRGSFNISDGSIIHQVNPSSALSILDNGNTCPGQIAIYVHGIWANEKQAEEQTDRVSRSLQNSGYPIPVIGFSWDSNTTIDPPGWIIAKPIANSNGLVLAKFIKDFKTQCPNDDLRIIAHSMGSRVTLSAIQSLYDNNPHIAVSKIIKSVHLLGAAVDDEQVSTDNQNECIHINSPPLKCSGQAIGLVVKNFYNLYDPEDNMLAPQTITYCISFYCWDYVWESPYHKSENDNPLGAYPIINKFSVPFNYNEYSVQDAIGLNDDANGDGKCDLILQGVCTIVYNGDNHMAYMGYRSSIYPYPVYNSGAIGFVAEDWRNQNN
jgi:hypothetical protein